MPDVNDDDELAQAIKKARGDERARVLRELLTLWRGAQPGAPYRMGDRLACDFRDYLISSGYQKEEL